MKHNTFHKNFFLICFCVCVFEGTWGQSNKLDTLNNFNQSDSIRYIAYSSQPSWMVTKAVSTIEGKELAKTFSSNFGNTLLGRLPGLMVVRSGSEAEANSPNLYARGIGTFSDNKNLLVIVDGFESKFEQLIPEEIESVTLLKDAASASMYGGRGANGVLLITTKRGNEGPMQISFSGQVGLESAVSLPDFLNSYDYAMLYNEALNNDGLPDLYTATDLEAYQLGNSPYFHPDVDWYDQVLSDYAPFSKYNLSFKGGLDKARYFVSLNALSRDGLYKETADLTDYSTNSEYKQYNIRTNVDLDVTQNLTASINLGMIFSDKSNPAAYTTAPVFDLLSSVPPNAFPVKNPNNTYGGNALYTNPWGDILETGYFTSNHRYVQSSLRLTQKLDMILSGLSATTAISFNNDFKTYSIKKRTYLRNSISDDGTGTPVYVEHGTETSLEASEGDFEYWRNTAFEAFLNYDLLSGKNQLHAKFGYNLDQVSFLGVGIPFKHLGMLGRITYAYNKKYIGELAFAYSGMNGLAPDKRFGLFPGASLGWIVSKEEFLQESNLISFLKIRGSYGITGNDYLGEQRFLYEQYYDYEGNFYYGPGNTIVGGYAEAQLANPDLSWEKEREMNVGFEAVLARNLNVSFDFFMQNRIDILVTPNNTVPEFLGATIPKLNIGEVTNSGFEATVGYSNNSTGNLHYFVNLSGWYARNEIVFMSEAPQRFEYMYRTGQPVNQPYLLEDLGFFQDQTDIDNSPPQLFSEVQPGDLKYKDQNGDNVIDLTDAYPTGYTDVPEITFSLNTGLKYKFIYLDLLFVGVTNRSVYLTGKDFYAFQQDAKVTSWALERWTPATSSSATYPRLSSMNNLNNFQQSTFWQRDGSFIKLQYAEIGFQLSNQIIKRINLSETRIFINGTNLFTLDKVEVADPEILSGYPAVRSYSIGAKIQF
ncbi:MAG: SusC/RagA family TonB-linked outer membrane protein [Bacteroidales bacterium]